MNEYLREIITASIGRKPKVLIKVDKNGSKHYIDHNCPKCGGAGVIECYHHVDGGACFKCGGTGVFEHKVVERTPEYEKLLSDRRAERAKKKAPETNGKFFAKFGLNADGDCWIAMGDTYSRREELKADGATYNDYFGWHYSEERPGTVKVQRDQVMEQYGNGTFHFRDFAPDIVKKIREANGPKGTSEWIGRVGDTLNMVLTLRRVGSYETHFGFRAQTVEVFTFTDQAGNALVWKTSSFPQLDEGNQYRVRGTVKEHCEYRGERQTVLTRCKVEKEEIA